MTDILLLTKAMALEAEVYDLWHQREEARFEARRLLRPDRQAAARKGVETRRARA